MYRNELVSIIYSRPMPRHNAKLHISRPRTGAMVIVLCATTVQGVPPECLGQTAKVEKKSALPLYSTRSTRSRARRRGDCMSLCETVSSPHRVSGFATLCIEVDRAPPVNYQSWDICFSANIWAVNFKYRYEKL